MDMKKAGILILGVLSIFFFVINPMEKSELQKSARKLSLADKWNQSFEDVKKSRSTASVKKKGRTPDQINDLRAKVPFNKFKFKNEELQKRLAKNKKVIKFERLSGDTNAQFNGPNGGYVILENVYAIKKSIESAVLFDGAEIKNNHYIIESEEPIEGALPVVENTESGNLGIFIGVLKIKVKDFKMIYDMIDEPNLSDQNIVYRVNEIPEISSGHFYFTRPLEAKSVYEKLFNHENIKRISLEVLEFARTTK